MALGYTKPCRSTRRQIPEQSSTFQPVLLSISPLMYMPSTTKLVYPTHPIHTNVVLACKDDTAVLQSIIILQQCFIQSRSRGGSLRYPTQDHVPPPPPPPPEFLTTLRKCFQFKISIPEEVQNNLIVGLPSSRGVYLKGCVPQGVHTSKSAYFKGCVPQRR